MLKKYWTRKIREGFFKKLVLVLHRFLFYWFDLNRSDKKITSENVFVISHFGQLSQVEGLIKEYNIRSSHLIVLYTSANMRMPSLIMEKYKTSYFDDCLLLPLPVNPNDYSLSKLCFMDRGYNNILSSLSIKHLYLLSFENHYALLAKRARERGISVSLIDEGTATYKNIESSLYTHRVGFFQLIISLVVFRRILPAYGKVDNFDCIYAAFPDLLRKKFNSKNYTYFFPHGRSKEIKEETEKLVHKYKINSTDLLYVNQKYPIKANLFIPTLVEILYDIAMKYEKKIFIKMHPRESKDSILILDNFIKSKYLNNRIVLIQECEFLVEELVQYVKPKAVIGLTSTSLVYSPLISDSTMSISIAPWLIKKLKGEVNEKNIEIIKNHLEILSCFPHVKIADSIPSSTLFDPSY